MLKWFIISIFILLVWISTAWAVTITMKSGRVINGEVVEKTDEYIKVQTKEQLWKIPVKELASETQTLLQISVHPKFEHVEVPAPPAAPSQALPARLARDEQKAGSGQPANLDDPQTITISINPLMDFNGLSRANILSLRQQYIQQIPRLAPANYFPNMAIFGQIQDGRPWWGMLGMCYYGPGQKSILGHAEESRFIVNPYLLIGVQESTAHIVRNSSLMVQEIYPKPTSLIWQQMGSWGRVTYDITSYYQKARLYRYTNGQDLYLTDYNARDQGFNSLAIDSALSKNIIGTFDRIIPIVQFIHTGGSCGYPGGCNNMSPTQAELNVQWNSLPARIYVKLWKLPVRNAAQKSDMDFIIDLN